jgi:hypothetical protein
MLQQLLDGIKVHGIIIQYKNWSDLPGNVQSAAQNLGFTQQMWDNDQWPAVGDNKYWDAMSDDEKTGLHTLGYNKYNWG